jgi:hypothetical protein
MEELTIIVDDKVGIVADISYILGKAKINIESIMVEVHGGKAIINLAVKDGKKAMQYLSGSGYRVLESELLVVKLKDEPGELSKMSALLAKEKINILNLFFISKEAGNTIMALKVDHAKKAEKLLSPFMPKK